MTSNKNLELFFNQYEDIISTGLEHNHSEKEIFNAIYSKEFNNYLRKGFEPRLNELNHVINFVKKFRSGELDYDVKSKSNSDQLDREISKIQNVRDFAIILDPNNEDDNYKIKNRMQGMIVKFEGNVPYAYYDFVDNPNEKAPKSVAERNRLGLHPNGKITVGIGFNMDQNGAKNEWLRVFPDNIPNFEDVKNGKTNIDKDQSNALFQESFHSRYNIVSSHYKNYWNNFTGNEQIAIMSVGYVKPAMVTNWDGKESNFSKNMKLWVDTRNEAYLDNAVKEIRFNSGSQAGKFPALQNRRNQEAEILATNKSPIYNGSKPIGFIWHHESVGKNPRQEHVARNGKTFYVDNPNYQELLDEIGKYNCHCWAEFIYE